MSNKYKKAHEPKIVQIWTKNILNEQEIVQMITKK